MRDGLMAEASRTLARVRLAADRTEAIVRMEKSERGEWRSWLLEECSYAQVHRVMRLSTSRLGHMARYEKSKVAWRESAKTCA